MIPWWGRPLQYASGLAVWIYVHLAYRVRMWGRLPRRRKAALVISNHQNDLDLMGFTALGFLTTGRRRPFVAATAKLLFEPGFMAMRIPWLWRALRKLNMGWFFLAIGLLPIENELQSRSIARWAWSVERLHGQLPLERIFKEGVVERYALRGLRTRDLFSPEHFQRAQETYVRITDLQPPYGKEQMELMRAGVTEDLARFEAAVRRGATLYVTPEGDYTVTGAMLPFRSIWERLEPLAEEIYIAAISYDPFAPKFSQLYRVVPLRLRDRARDELCAARAVTVSAILAGWLIERNAEFSEEEAIGAVRDSLHSMPAGVFVDPELLQSPEILTRRALAAMCGQGSLERTAGRYALTGKRRHPNFPMVEDIVAFQARVIDETLAAAESIQACLPA